MLTAALTMNELLLLGSSTLTPTTKMEIIRWGNLALPSGFTDGKSIRMSPFDTKHDLL